MGHIEARWGISWIFRWGGILRPDHVNPPQFVLKDCFKKSIMLNKSPNQNQIKDLISLYNKKSFHQVIFKSSDLVSSMTTYWLLFVK